MRPVVPDRRSEIARIQRLLERLHSPRLQMMLIVALTGAAGFLASFLLLAGGLDAMWARYPLAIAFAYAAFLFFLWCWLRLRGDDLADFLDFPTSGGSSRSAAAEKAFEGGGGNFGGGGASGSFKESGFVATESPGTSSSGGSAVSEAAGALELEELAIVLVALAALVGAAWAAIWIVWAAPALFAELLLDAALTGGLYRRLRHVRGDHWLQTALRLTGWQFAAVAVIFSLAGAGMHLFAPEAKSIGQVLEAAKTQNVR